MSRLREKTTATLLIAIFMISIFAVVMPVSAATINVPSDQPTIQLAIDAAGPGDTILVTGGPYTLTSPIIVDESVTITGDTATPSNVVIDASGILGDDSDGFQIKASGVTIQGFAIHGALDKGSSQNSGIVIGNWWDGPLVPVLQNIDISYNEITGCSKGISVYRAQHITISHNKIHHNPTGGPIALSSWPGKGIMLYGDVLGDQIYDIDILNNEIYGNGLMGIELNVEGVGDNVDMKVLIDGNKIYDNGGYMYDLYDLEFYRGISANAYTQNVVITNNEIYGHWAGTGDQFYAGVGAIRAQNAKDWEIRDNDIHDNFRGIYIYEGSIGFEITGNDIYSNAQGLVVQDDVGYAHYNNIHDNDITTYIGLTCPYGQGDGTPYGALNLGTTSFDATLNWWGHASGPSGPNGRTNPAGKEVGKGDAVSAIVDWDPWLRRRVWTNPAGKQLPP